MKELTNNQEDSQIMSQGAIDRGLFNGCKITFYKTELMEQKEEFGTPHESTTDPSTIKAKSYEKLTNGKIKKGTVVEKDDAIIGKLYKIPPKEGSKYKYVDKSIIYKEDEPAVVHEVIEARNDEDIQFIKVVLRKIRPVSIGDKHCLTADHEVLTLKGWKKIDKITKKDYVATLNTNEDFTLEYQNPIETYEYYHNGDMYDLDSQFVKLKTTLNHKMFVKDKKQNYKLIEASKIVGKKKWYKRNANHYSEKEKSRKKLDITLKSLVSKNKNYFSKNIVDKIQHLCIESGYNISIQRNKIIIDKDTTSLEPLVGGKTTEEKIVSYNGKVYCLEVPNHIFMVRYKNKCCWTGNSSRAGQYNCRPETQLNCGNFLRVQYYNPNRKLIW